MEEFIRRAGLESAVDGTGPKFLHIGGTNGKGSVTAFVQSIAIEHGHRTGAFFSPYVVDLRERVQFGRDLISKVDFARLVEELLPIGDQLAGTHFGGITEFELKTAIGFKYWSEKACEWVALEVGLGGRLDSTNVVTPAASAIVSIGLDHVDILGDTIEKIAEEKAGIIKPDVPIVVGEMPPEALAVIARRAADLDARLLRYGPEFDFWSEPGEGRIITPQFYDRVESLGLEGEVQWHNAAVAVMVCEAGGMRLEREKVMRGLATASAPGRFQRVKARGLEWIVDGAHNAEAAAKLAQSLNRAFGDRKLNLVMGMVKGHDPVRLLQALRPVASHIDFAPIDFPRSRTPEELLEVAKSIGIESEAHASLQVALAASAWRGSNPIVITGSFYLAGEALRELEQA
ncbi:MAG: Folylpolyglutamate synthase [Fimbriimonadaceae bacterium]|nr:Folylpolyglutamate synthase [Fimbriimonadaceae bacterium]